VNDMSAYQRGLRVARVNASCNGCCIGFTAGMVIGFIIAFLVFAFCEDPTPADFEPVHVEALGK